MNQRTGRHTLAFHFFGLVALLGVAVTPNLIHAEDQGSDPEQSYFSNPAQEQHAQNLADAWAAEHEEEIGQAYMDLAEAKEKGDPAAIQAAEARLTELQVSVKDIEAMRSEGMGWGQIAHKLGLHPSVLGNGHQAPGKLRTAKNQRIGANGTVNANVSNSSDHANQAGGKGKDSSGAKGGKASGKGKNK
jgi:hypothetical protein